jgi:outer membrane protein OmpA-like peptidoglycan-associated protein
MNNLLKFQFIPQYLQNKFKYLSNILLFLIIQTFPLITNAQTDINENLIKYRVVVNSGSDSSIQPDEKLTLREAIELVNNTLSVEELSNFEKAQVTVLNNQQNSKIEFNLPVNNSVIKLQELLPPIMVNGLTIDGTSNPGYDSTKTATLEKHIPIPVVSITPVNNSYIFRGLTIIADNVTIKGLSIYGFNGQQGITSTTPPADIFIAHQFLPANPNHQYPEIWNRANRPKENPPQNVIIEDNWLGINPNEEMPDIPSAFGVSVFNGQGTIIRNNRIASHEGSGIITALNVQNILIEDNLIIGNGLAGMPDGIRLEGNINNGEIRNNLICGNDGSGVFLFKPEGSVKIYDNDLKFNGKRLRRSAVYLMGKNHQVYNNKISNQMGPGVVISSYPQSEKILIQNNLFSLLEGLSIDLVTRHNVGIQDYYVGDGHNYPRDTENRRLDTANNAINTPQFLSDQFFFMNGKVGIDGMADPDSIITLYQVKESGSLYGPLSKPLAEVTTNSEGKFSFSLNNLKPGDHISAIATHPDFGTSEPAYNAVITNLGNTETPVLDSPIYEIPRCTNPPQIVQPPLETPPIPPQEPIILRVPRNVHFALDKSNISPESAVVLDRVIEVLLEHPYIIIELQGHTDSRASDQYNQALGNRRSSSVRDYLLRRGVAPERMTIRSFGESQLRVAENTVTDYARNRRVEILFKDVRGLNIIFETQEDDLQLER